MANLVSTSKSSVWNRLAEHAHDLTRVVLYAFLTLSLVIIYFQGLFIPLMHNDAGHHAKIAMHMHESGDYISLIDAGADYLDKPHFLFWSAALFFKLLGVTTFSYKITSFLFSLIALFATYKVATLLYTKRTGILAALILSTSFTFLLSNNDVRMDAVLTACIIFSIWQLVDYFRTRRISSFVLAAIGMAVGFSTKGMIGIVMPLIAIFFFLLYERNWRDLFHVRWILLGLITLIFITPVLYCFYLQFDLHPEKIVRGTSGHSGVMFMLFGQSVERLQGKAFGSQGSNDPLFFLHTYLWAFLPWSLIGLTAYWKQFRWFIRRRFKQYTTKNLLVIGTITVIFILISTSRFKLPHYINVLTPLLAIMSASYLMKARQKTLKDFLITQKIVTVLLIIVAGAVCCWFFPITGINLVISGVLLAILIYTLTSRAFSTRQSVVLVSFASAVFLYFILNFHFYPTLLTYQGGKAIADYAVDHEIDLNEIHTLAGYETTNDLDFYSRKLIPSRSYQDLKNSHQSTYIVTGEEGYSVLERHKIAFTVVTDVPHYHVTRLKFKFLNPATREQTLRKLYLIQTNPEVLGLLR